mgnify:CR=1 FL=1
MKNKHLFLLVLIAILAASLACSLITDSNTDVPTAEEAQPPAQQEAPPGAKPTLESPPSDEGKPEGPPAGKSTEYDTIFTLPPKIENFTGNGGDTAINFQTDMSLDEVIRFYRRAFTEEGLTERGINTAITDTTFSMVFDGHPKGQAIVIQGVDLGNGMTNVNIRFEDV